MVRRQLDALVRALSAAGSRREALAVLLGGGLGMLTLAGPGSRDVEAKKKKKRRRQRRNKRQQRRKRRRNQDACGDVCASGCSYRSIQAALDAAQNGATIRLCAETYEETIDISKDVTLIGAGDGADGTILDGQGAGSVISLTGSRTLTLEGLRITGGNSPVAGGGILSSSLGNLTLTDCTVTGNVASNYGGGIFINLGNLTLTGGSIIDNDAGIDGGGIYSSLSSVALTNCSVTGNEAIESGGGGIYSGDSLLTLTDSDVAENTAGVEGGGIYNEPGGKVTLNGTSSVEGNEPDNCGGGGTFDGTPCVN